MVKEVSVNLCTDFFFCLSVFFFFFFKDEIFSLSLATSLPTLPFEVFRQLLDCSPLTTDDGVLLRRMCIEVGAIHLVLNCLGIFTHQSQMYQLSGIPVDVSVFWSLSFSHNNN